MRRISLLNRLGESYDLTSKSAFFHEPKGFGYAMNNSYRLVGNRWVPVKNELSQSVISGTIAFPNQTAYYDYFEFVRFCNSAPLTLIYTTDDSNTDTIENTTHHKKVLCTSIEKGDIDPTTSALMVEVAFTSLTPWYKNKLIDVPIDQQATGWTWSDDARTKPFWGVKWSDMEKMTAILTVDTTMSCPTKLKIYGPIQNPSWDVYANGAKLSSGSVAVYVPGGNYLSIDCTKDPYEMKIYSVVGDEALSDVYQLSDFSTERFVWLNHGKNSISVHSVTDANVRITLEANVYYDSV